MPIPIGGTAGTGKDPDSNMLVCVTLADAYANRRPNLLNAIRLVLAVGVIFWHSIGLSGSTLNAPAQITGMFGSVFVDGFFAVSGFLILRSWLRDPSARNFLAARFLRIFPAFWACLIVTAFGFAPLAAVLSSGTHTGVSSDNALYVFRNLALWIFQYGIEGTLQDVAYPNVWNGSLWTLSWEFLCYLAVLAFGLLKLWTRRWPVCIAFGIVWLATVVGVDERLHSDIVDSALRFALMFLAGCLLAQFQNHIRVTWVAVLASAAIVAGSAWLPDYRVLGALPLAYVLVGVGALVSRRRLSLRNDISYGMYIYAFPVQQMLATLGAANGDPVLFGTLAALLTAPFAILSWVMVERPALKLRPTRQPATNAALVPS